MRGDTEPGVVIEQVYAAALDENLWADALTRVADCLGAAGATLEIIDKSAATPAFFRGARLPDDGIQDYLDHYAAICPRLRYINRQPGGHVTHDRLLITEAEMDRDPFYAEFLRRDDFRYFIAGTLRNDDRYFSLITAQRTVGQGHVDTDDVAALTQMLPHVGQALDLHMRLRSRNRQQQSLQATLDQLADGVVLLDAAARVLFCNDAAAKLLSNRDGLDIRAGELLPRASWAARDLGRAIHRALKAHAGDPAEAGGDVLVPRADDRPSLILAIRPLPFADGLTADLYAEARQPAVAVFIQDPGRAAASAARILSGIFKLTPAETRLALALYRGQTLKRYAADNEISINTARSHLARAMRKTNTSRQAELIRLINTIDLPAR